MYIETVYIGHGNASYIQTRMGEAVLSVPVPVELRDMILGFVAQEVSRFSSNIRINGSELAENSVRHANQEHEQYALPLPQ